MTLNGIFDIAVHIQNLKNFDIYQQGYYLVKIRVFIEDEKKEVKISIFILNLHHIENLCYSL